ncbi:MAG: hypothetical protein NTY36_01330 [Deltaproteobacteria bacterium]|nr:hypothetical protein [Deltaproteobacteria bacterium]
METAAFLSALDKIAPYGVPAIMALLFFFIIRIQAAGHTQSLLTQDRANGKILEQYQNVLAMYKADLAGMNGQMSQILREMSAKYDDNARLVENYGRLTERYARRAESLERIIQVNIQSMQEASDAVNKCRQKVEGV